MFTLHEKKKKERKKSNFSTIHQKSSIFLFIRSFALLRFPSSNLYLRFNALSLVEQLHKSALTRSRRQINASIPLPWCRKPSILNGCRSGKSFSRCWSINQRFSSVRRRCRENRRGRVDRFVSKSSFRGDGNEFTEAGRQNRCAPR